MPALFSLFVKGFLPSVRVIGVARREWSQAQFQALVRQMLDTEEFSLTHAAVKDTFVSCVSYVQSSFESQEGYRAVRSISADPSNRLMYLAVPPDSYQVILDGIRRSGLSEQVGGFSRLVLEKPFGRDLESARRLNAMIASAFREDQIYRIDHYLGKETVQNIMLLRFGNEIFEPIWNNRYVDHVQITMAETVGVESRGGYYERAGALRDMVQNHMLQLLCLVAMEPPVDQDPDSIRDEKLKVLKSIKPIRGAAVATETVRGQYQRGIMNGTEAAAYREEPGVSEDSQAETYAALRLHLDSWRWAGVPFYLRTGKRLSRRTTEISVHFRRPPLALFGPREHDPQANVLVFRIQPKEGITVKFNAKVPGYASDMREVNMDFSYGSAFGEELAEAYERLLLDCMIGDSTLFMRQDEVENAWGFVTQVLEGWNERGLPKLAAYKAGSSGPDEASALLGEDRRWRRL